MAIRNSITFGGVNSADFGIYISGEGVFNAPERDVEMIEIPGRNGELALDKGRFRNIEVTYPAFNFEPNDYDTFAQNLSDFRNAICSQIGYQRLTDTFHPGEYRMATYISGLEINPIKYNTASEFELVFNCKPQRYLTSGEEPITIGEWRDTETVTGDIVEVENPDGLLGVKSLSVALEPIQDLNGYDKPWSGGNGKNKFDIDAIVPFNANVTLTKTADTLTITNNNTYAVGLFRVEGGDMILPVSDGNYTISMAEAISINLAVYASSDGTSFSWYDGGITAGQTSRTFTVSGKTHIKIVGNVGSGRTITVKKFQFEQGSTASTWTPYSNICPISGRTECDTYVSGKNVCDTSNYTSNKWNVFGIPNTLKPNTTYTFSINGSTSINYSLWLNNSQTTAQTGAQLTSYTASGGSKTFTTPSEMTEEWLLLGGSSPATENIDIADLLPQIELGTTATDYEAFDGQTYTTTLGRTVYGGTLDVVSGELTLTKAMHTFDGTETFGGDGGANYVVPRWNELVGGASYSGYCLSNMLQKVNSYASIRNTVGSMTVNSGRVLLNPEGTVYANTTSAINFIRQYCIDMANNGTPLQVVYELATPQTYQLSGQDIELITGHNNIWSDGGSITLEYGQLPNIVNNPTLFEASPLLDITGYGVIGFNGYSIDATNINYGDIVIRRYRTESLSGIIEAGQQYYSFSFDDSVALNGDSITVGSLVFNVALSSIWTFDSERVIGSGFEYEYSTSGLSAYIKMEGVSFTLGTVGHKGYRAAFVDAYNVGRQIQILVDYDGNTSFTMAVSYIGIDSFVFASDSFILHSSKLITTGNYYIDTELGEAYKIEDGQAVSLNGYIDLGSDLPTLASGANTITSDNTVTDLKVVPRYWKI